MHVNEVGTTQPSKSDPQGPLALEHTMTTSMDCHVGYTNADWHVVFKNVVFFYSVIGSVILHFPIAFMDRHVTACLQSAVCL